MVSTARKSVSTARKSVSTSQNEGFAVKINPHWAEKSFNCQDYLKERKKMVSTTQATRFH